MNIEISIESGITIVAAEGRLDGQGAIVFEQHCKDSISAGATMILVDLSRIAYISSAGLRSALVIGKQLNSKGGEILFCNAPANVYDVFSVSGFATIFKFFNSKEDALGAVGKQ